MRIQPSWFRAGAFRFSGVAALIVLCLCAGIAIARMPDGESAERLVRTGHTATLMADGRVLIVGGERNGMAIARADVVDPASGSTGRGGTAAFARADHSATRLDDGRVLIAGGRNGSTAIDSVELWDPQTSAFAVAGKLTVPRTGHAAVSLGDGRVLIAGGDADGSMDLFDGSSFRAINSRLSEPRFAAAIALLDDGRVLVAGGRDTNGVALDTADLVDVTTGNVERMTMKSARVAPMLHVLPDGKVQVIGGDRAATMEIFTGRGFTALTVLRALDARTIAGTPARFAFSNPDESKIEAAIAGARSAVTNSRPGRAISVNSKMRGVRSEPVGPWVTTDKADYAPGQTVIVTGGNFAPGETVTLLFERNPETSQATTLTVVADAAGGFTNSDYTCLPTDFGVTFTLTATGRSSGLVAMTSFTDALSTFTVTYLAGSATYGTSSNVQYTVFVQSDSCAAAETVQFSLASGPTGVTADTPVANYSFPACQASATITLSTTGTGATRTFAGVNQPFTVTADSSAGAGDTVGGGPGQLTVAQANLSINAVTNTKTYNGLLDAAAIPTVVGLIGTDSVAGLAEQYTTKTVGIGNKVLVVSPGYTVIDGNGGANYNVTTNNFNTGTINPRPLNVSVGVLDKDYDCTTTAAIDTAFGVNDNGYADDRVGGDVLTFTTNSANFTSGGTPGPGNQDAGTGKTVTVSYTLGGADSGNYSYTSPIFTTADINPATPTVTASFPGNGTYTYDGAAHGITGSASYPCQGILQPTYEAISYTYQGFEADGSVFGPQAAPPTEAGRYEAWATYTDHAADPDNFDTTDSAHVFLVITRANPAAILNPNPTVYNYYDAATHTYDEVPGSTVRVDGIAGTLVTAPDAQLVVYYHGDQTDICTAGEVPWSSTGYSEAGRYVVGVDYTPTGGSPEANNYNALVHTAACTSSLGCTGVGEATITNGGSGYTNATVSFSGGAGAGATAVASLRDGAIVGIVITNPGSGYTDPVTVNFAGDGAGATGTAFTAAFAGSAAIQNGGFEVPEQAVGAPNNYTYYRNPGFTNWTTGTGVDQSNAGIAENGSAFAADTAPQGDQVAFIQSGNLGLTQTPGSIQQSLLLAAGTYTVYWKENQRVCCSATDQTVRFLVDGNLITTTTPLTGVWTQRSASFSIVSSGTHTIQFQGGAGNLIDATAFIDDVTINVDSIVGTRANAGVFTIAGAPHTITGPFTTNAPYDGVTQLGVPDVTVAARHEYEAPHALDGQATGRTLLWETYNSDNPSINPSWYCHVVSSTAADANGDSTAVIRIDHATPNPSSVCTVRAFYADCDFGTPPNTPAEVTQSIFINPALAIVEWATPNATDDSTPLTQTVGTLGAPNSNPPHLDAVVYWVNRQTGVDVNTQIDNVSYPLNPYCPGCNNNQYTYYPPAGSTLVEGQNQVLSLEFTTNNPDFISPRAYNQFIDVNATSGPPPPPLAYCDTYHYPVMPSRTIAVGTTLGSAVVTSAGLFKDTDQGAFITATGINGAAAILSVTNASTVTISTLATATSAPTVPATISPVTPTPLALPGRNFTVVTTTGSPTVTSNGLFSAADVGLSVTGTGIPTGAYITAFTNASTVTISGNATKTGATYATFTRTFSVTTTSGNPNVTSAGRFLATDVGRSISGFGIPVGATITTFTSANQISISPNPTATGARTVLLNDGPMRGMVSGNFGGDVTGRPDLLVAHAKSLAYYQGNGDGTFTQPTVQVRRQGDGVFPATVDLHSLVNGNFDGGPNSFDTALTDTANNRVYVFLYPSTVPAVLNTGTTPYGLTAADLTGDGRPELVVTNWGSNSVQIFWNNGAGSFSQLPLAVHPGDPAGINPSTYTLNAGDRPWGVVTGDFIGGPAIDVMVALNGTINSVAILEGDGSGRFVSLSKVLKNVNGPYPRTLAAGDLDDDGDTDVIVGNYGNPATTPTGSIVKMINTPGDNFTTSLLAPVVRPSSIVIGDLASDGDSIPDVAAVSASANTLYLYKGASAGADNYTVTAFSNNTKGVKATAATPHSIVFDDFDLTTPGKLEIATSNASEIRTFAADIIPAATISATVVIGGTPVLAPPYNTGGQNAVITVNLTGTGPYVVKWSDGLTQSTTASTVSRTVNPAAPTAYTITSVTGGSACGGTGGATITIEP